MFEFDITSEFISFVSSVSETYCLPFNVCFLKIVDVISSMKDSELYCSLKSQFSDSFKCF